MKLYIVLAASAVLALTTSAQAVQLVVISTNSNTGIAGQKAYIIGVQISSADRAIAGPNATLSIHNLTFTGGVNGPVNGANGSTNRPDVQSLQTAVIDGAGEFPPQNADFTANGINAIYRDSWWYNSGTGLLNGVVDASFNSGTVTTTSGGTIGPTNAVGTTGFLWTPNGASGIVPANALNGQTMQYSGTYGPSGSNTLDGPTLAPLFSGGILTVPLVQIVATGDIQVPGSYPQLTGSFISVGNKNYYNNIGIISFSESGPPIVFYLAPEPGTVVLATLGALGLLLARRRLKEL